MPDRFELIILLGALVVTLLLVVAAAIDRVRIEMKLFDDMKKCALYYKNLAHEYKAERDIALARAKSHCSFWELRKDERIEELEAENRALRESMQEV